MIRFLFTLLFLSSSAFSSETIRVAVVDTGLDLNDPRFSGLLCEDGNTSVDLTGTTIKDTEGHGTHVAGLIKKYARDSNYCLIIIKYYLDNTDGNLRRFKEAIRIAEYENSDIINISGGGESFDEWEKDLIESRPEITFVVSAGNEGWVLTTLHNHCIYPACYNLPNIIVVGSINSDGSYTKSSNKGNKVKIWEMGEHVLSYAPNNKTAYMSGTSMSTAIHTGKLIYERNH